jgi:multidrug resistance efflux pump
MKIRFRVPEATDPQRDGGMRLPPQQSKRVPPRWRWLLVTLLALSPALAIGGVLLHGWLWIDVSGYVVLEETRITAPHAGTVRTIHAENGQGVAAGAPLIELDNRELRAELEALKASGEGPRLSGSDLGRSALSRQIGAVRARLQAQQRQTATLEALHANGAATQGEVLAAIARASDTEGELAALERERARHRDGAGVSAESLIRMTVLADRLRELGIHAPVGGTVDDLGVSQGQNVERGESLLVIRRGEPKVIGFMQGREALSPGAAVRIVLPDGQTVSGHVVGQAPSTRLLPEELSGSFGRRDPRRQVIIAPETLPPEARIHRLPVTVRAFRFRGARQQDNR